MTVCEFDSFNFAMGRGSFPRDPRMIQYSIVGTFGRGGYIDGICNFPPGFPFLTVVTTAPNLDLSTLLFTSTNLLRYKHSSVVQFGFLFFDTLHVELSSLFSAIFNACQKQTIIFGCDYPYYKNHKHNKT